MKTNQLAFSFLCLLLILYLQGCGQKKTQLNLKKTSSTATNQLESGNVTNESTNEVGSRFAQLKASAEQGDTEAQFNLGIIYAKGIGVEKDAAKSFEWIHKAAEQGNVVAQGLVGWMYDIGDGVNENRVEAAKWYLKAAEQGDIVSENNLALLYDNGDGVPQN